MEITWRDAGDGVVIGALSGRLNMASAPQLDAAIAAALVAGWRKITLDLGELEFLDSSGLGAIIAALKVARAEGADLRVANPSWQAQMVLKLTNMDHVLTIYAEPEAAYANG